MQTLLSNLELAGLVSAELRIDGSVVITVQAGLVDPRSDIIDAKRKSKPSNLLGRTQRMVFNAIVLHGVHTVQGVYDHVVPRLPLKATKRDRRAEVVIRAMRRLHEREFIIINNGMIEPGKRAEAAE